MAVRTNLRSAAVMLLSFICADVSSVNAQERRPCNEGTYPVWVSGSYRERIEVFFDESLDAGSNKIVRFEKWKKDRRIWITYGHYGCLNACQISFPVGWSPKALEEFIESDGPGSQKRDSTLQWRTGFALYVPNFRQPTYFVIANLDSLARNYPSLIVRWERLRQSGEQERELRALETSGLPKVYRLARCRPF